MSDTSLYKLGQLKFRELHESERMRLFAQTPLIRLWLALGRSECCYGLAPLLTGDLELSRL